MKNLDTDDKYYQEKLEYDLLTSSPPKGGGFLLRLAMFC